MGPRGKAIGARLLYDCRHHPNFRLWGNVGQARAYLCGRHRQHIRRGNLEEMARTPTKRISHYSEKRKQPRGPFSVYACATFRLPMYDHLRRGTRKRSSFKMFMFCQYCCRCATFTYTSTLVCTLRALERSLMIHDF